MRSRRCLSIALPLVVFLLSGRSATEANTIHVPGDYATIQAAIDAAGDGDTVQVAAGTYHEKLSYVETAGAARSIALVGAGPEQTTVDAGGAGTCFYMVNVPASATVEGFTFTNGGNVTNGPGLYLYRSDPTITNNVIATNPAVGSAACVRGGGVYIVESSPTLENNTIAGNRAWYGAGVYASDSAVTLRSNTIEQNVGGPSYGAGAGVYLQDCVGAVLVNNVIAGNTAISSGGGVYLVGSTATLTNNTIAANQLTATSPVGAGLYANLGLVDLTNCIVWGNSGADDLKDVSGTVSVNYSDIGPLGGGLWPGDYNINANPLFVDPGSGDYHLQAGSPCIDAGDDSAPHRPDTDLDGNPRIAGDQVDMGAYEFQEPSNQPPVANGDGPYLGLAGVPLLIDASASYDDDDDALTYKWNFGDGSTLETADAIIEHTYVSPGIYTLTLVVNDGEADSQPCTTQATIGDPGSGQGDDVDAFLSYVSPPSRKVTLPVGTTSYDVIIIYGPTIQAGTFEAKLNKDAFGGFIPVPETTQTVTISVAKGRNTLNLQVDGTRADGKTATDKDKLVFIVP